MEQGENMVWQLLALTTAVMESAKDTVSKKSLKLYDAYTIGIVTRLFPLPFILIILIITGIPKVSNSFWMITILNGCLNIIATVLYIKALRDDISLVTPMVTFTPLFMILTSYIMLGETFSPINLIGILLIFLGSYTLNVKRINEGILAPFKALLKVKGVQYMLMVALIWSITANLDKMGVMNSSPFFYLFVVNIIIVIGLSGLHIIKRVKVKRVWKNGNGKDGAYSTILIVFIGIFSTVGIISQMCALPMTNAANVIAIKRTSILMNIIAGKLFFKEEIMDRLFGGVLMLLGSIFIMFF